jgi:hypothetical protein
LGYWRAALDGFFRAALDPTSGDEGSVFGTASQRNAMSALVPSKPRRYVQPPFKDKMYKDDHQGYTLQMFSIQGAEHVLESRQKGGYCGTGPN